MGTLSDADRRRALAAAPTELLIGGSWRAAGEGARMDVEDPASGSTPFSTSHFTNST